MNREFHDADHRRAVCESQWDDREHGEALYPHVVRYVQEAPWAILPSTLVVILDLIAFRAEGGHLTTEQIRERIGAVSRPSYEVREGVAVLPLWGVIGHRMGMMSEMSGGTSTERFTQRFREAVEDPAVGAIVLDVDSPGGTVQGVDELAGEIHRARIKKPISAVANSLAASAAYWIASATEKLYAIPTGEVGSIGVLAAHEDLSGEMARRGRAVTLISAGRYKTEGSPYGPLTDEAKSAIQERVDEYYAMFTRAVARHRSVSVEAVRDGYGEGRIVGARQAEALGMVDGIATLDEVVTRAHRQLNRAAANAELTTQAELRRRLLRISAVGGPLDMPAR